MEEDTKQDKPVRSVHDMRDYFYRVVSACVLAIKRAAIDRDLPQKRLMIDELLNWVYPDFTEEEKQKVDNLMKEARTTERELIHNPRRGSAFEHLRREKYSTLDDQLRIAERTIYIYMENHNMRLPKGGDDEWSEEQIMEMMD